MGTFFTYKNIRQLLKCVAKLIAILLPFIYLYLNAFILNIFYIIYCLSFSSQIFAFRCGDSSVMFKTIV